MPFCNNIVVREEIFFFFFFFENRLATFFSSLHFTNFDSFVTREYEMLESQINGLFGQGRRGENLASVTFSPRGCVDDDD